MQRQAELLCTHFGPPPISPKQRERHLRTVGTKCLSGNMTPDDDPDDQRFPTKHKIPHRKIDLVGKVRAPMSFCQAPSVHQQSESSARRQSKARTTTSPPSPPPRPRHTQLPGKCSRRAGGGRGIPVLVTWRGSWPRLLRRHW